MQTPLVPTNAAARHPLRRTLPPPALTQPYNHDGDLKLFVLSFTAFFICLYSFIM